MSGDIGVEERVKETSVLRHGWRWELHLWRPVVVNLLRCIFCNHSNT